MIIYHALVIIIVTGHTKFEVSSSSYSEERLMIGRAPKLHIHECPKSNLARNHITIAVMSPLAIANGFVRRVQRQANIAQCTHT